MESANDMFDIGKFVRQHGTHLRLTHKLFVAHASLLPPLFGPFILSTRIHTYTHAHAHTFVFAGVRRGLSGSSHSHGFGLLSASFYRAQHSRISRRVAQLPRALFPAQFYRALRLVCFLFACQCKMRAVVNCSDERNAHCNMLPILAIFYIGT